MIFQNIALVVLQLRYWISFMLILFMKHVKSYVLPTFGLIFLGFSIYVIQKNLRGHIALLVLICLIAAILSFRFLKRFDNFNKFLYFSSKNFEKIKRNHKIFIYLISFLGISIYLIVSRRKNPIELRGFGGIFAVLLLCWVLSENIRESSWEIAFYSITIQLILGVLSLKWDALRSVLSAVGDGLKTLGEYSDEGSKFVFGEKFKLHSFAMEVMPRMVFFNGLSKVLESLGLLQWAVSKIGKLLYHLLGTTAGESFLAGANIFLGPENSIQLVQPMIGKMSRSEIHTVISCGLAAIDAGMVAVYVNIGISGRHLITASLLSAPAALGLSKLLIGPDIQNSTTMEYQKPEKCSIVETFRKGAYEAVKIICNILVTLMAFIAIVSFINGVFAWMASRVGGEKFTLQKASSYLLYPLIYMSGVEPEDCLLVGELFATKTFINEFVAYSDLKKLIDNRENNLSPSISQRSELISTFALCGFSNFGTLGTNVGFLCAIAPHKTGNCPLNNLGICIN